MCNTTRDNSRIILGASPTASVSLLNASRGYAAIIRGSDKVTTEDVKAVAFDVLNHRLVIRDLEEGQDTKDYGVSKINDLLQSSMESIQWFMMTDNINSLSDITKISEDIRS